MQSQTKNRKTYVQVARMAERAFAGLSLAAGEDALLELKEGWFNAAYNVRLSDGREVILKIAPPQGAEVMTYEQNLMATEVAAMRLAATNPAIPVPEVYAYDPQHDLCDSDYFFMEKLSGENYSHVRESLPQSVQAEIDREIGGIVRQINTFTGNYFGYDGNPALRDSSWKGAFFKICDSILEDGALKQAEYGLPVESIRAALLSHASVLEEVTVPQLVHWDAWDLNIFVKDGKVSGIIDFERALWADPLMEAQFRSVDAGNISESLRGYGKTEFSPTELVRCHLYTLHLGLVMKTEDYYRHYDTDEVSQMARKMIEASIDWLNRN